jgi:hypothetical protein
MYTVDAWTGQLDGRLSSLQMLLSSPSTPDAEPRRPSLPCPAGASSEDVLKRALKRLEEDVPYHAALFHDANSLRTLQMVRPHALKQYNARTMKAEQTSGL